MYFIYYFNCVHVVLKNLYVYIREVWVVIYAFSILFCLYEFKKTNKLKKNKSKSVENSEP